ncbi:MAG TPA: hypothetical protein VHM90_04115 [Phycisphaerae bacterium]|nr:hypothetical protein [Phycisphaerae bacterium]
MIELILMVVMVVAIVRIASVDGQSPIIWGAAAIGFGFLCLFIPLPYARVLIAGVLTVAAMTTYKMVRK